MGLRLWLFFAAVGGLAHLILYTADREINAGVDRLYQSGLIRSGELGDDSNMKRVSARSPYMRNER
jgi:hypothetical protein